jgi:hypothetical protein
MITRRPRVTILDAESRPGLHAIQAAATPAVARQWTRAADKGLGAAGAARGRVVGGWFESARWTRCAGKARQREYGGGHGIRGGSPA